MTQSARRATTRAALLAATIDSLRAQGVAGTSTRGVAERAGVSQGALQHHFPNKAQLVEATLSASLVTSLEELLAPPYDAPAAPAAHRRTDRGGPVTTASVLDVLIARRDHGSRPGARLSSGTLRWPASNCLATSLGAFYASTEG